MALANIRKHWIYILVYTSSWTLLVKIQIVLIQPKTKWLQPLGKQKSEIG